eukprot:COSAG04_NODE_794_length_10264_cov_35.102804_4_plen_65_part_00
MRGDEQSVEFIPSVFIVVSFYVRPDRFARAAAAPYPPRRWKGSVAGSGPGVWPAGVRECRRARL